MQVTEYNVGRWCLSEDECIAQGIDFAAYERGVADAAKAFGQNAGAAPTPQQPDVLLTFSLSYMDGVMEGESAEIQRHWRRVRDAAIATPTEAVPGQEKQPKGLPTALNYP